MATYPRSPYGDAFIPETGDAAAENIVQAIDGFADLVVETIDEVTARNLTGVKRIRLTFGDRVFYYRYDSLSTEPHDPPRALRDSEQNVFILVARDMTDITDSGGEVTLDFDENTAFRLTATNGGVINVPVNCLPGESFYLEVIVSGTIAALTLGPGWEGQKPEIRAGDGQITTYSGVVRTIDPSVTAFINEVNKIAG